MKSLNILLLNPPGKKLYIRDYYCSKVSKAGYIYEPVDLLILSGILLSRHNIHVLDAMAYNLRKASNQREGGELFFCLESVWLQPKQVKGGVMKILNKKLKMILGIIGIAVLMSFNSVNAQTCVQAPEGIVSWWPGDGNANDIAGANHGTVQGNVMFAPGMVGEAFRLYGSGFILVPDSPTLDLTNEITIEMWYNEDDISWFRALIGKRCDNWSIPGCNTNYGVNIHDYYGLGVYYQDPTVNGGDDWIYGSVYETSRFKPVPSPKQFHHFAGTYKQIDPTQIEVKTYVDG